MDNEKFEIETLEKMFVDGEIKDLKTLVDKKMDEFKKNMTLTLLQAEETYIDKNGEEKKRLNPKYKNPIVLNNYFLKSINPYKNIQPEYTAESLNVIFDLYCDILAEVNVKIGTLAPSISSFCKFAGISSNTFKGYKSNPDENIRNLIDIIEDYCYDTNVAMSQTGLIKERTTVYRMKSEQEKMEREQQHVVINAKEVNIGDIQEKIKRIQELKKFNNKSRLIEAEFKEKTDE